MLPFEYDTSELTVLQRMRRFLHREQGWELADFVEMTFADVEAEYFAAGGVEFRPGE